MTRDWFLEPIIEKCIATNTMKIHVFLFLLFIAKNSPADDLSNLKANCPNREKLKNMCMIVGNHMPDKSGEYKFLFQRRFYESACVRSSDSTESKNKKLQEVWRAGQGNYLACTGADFEVLKGNILKYAIAAKFDEFIDEMIRWKVDLNIVDDSDKNTVLDYVTYQIDKNKGNESEIIYQLYYIKLRQAGAKRAAELK